MATVAQINKFIKMLAPIVVKVCESKTRKVLPSVCIAQACYETGYGTTARMMATNGLFGIKVGKNAIRFGNGWQGSSYNTKTKEYYGSKEEVAIIRDNFRSYSSIENSVIDYYDMLASCSRYSSCIGVTDYRKAITAIVNGGYATDPDYIDNIISIINKRKLYQYDDIMVGTSKIDNVAVSNANYNTKHSINEKITVSRFYSNSMANKNTAIIKVKTAIIVKIKEDALHPYLLGTTTNTSNIIGWTGDEDIINKDTTEVEEYTVVSGDTMSKIAKMYNTTPTKLVSINKSKYPNIKAGYIRVGWKLRIS